MDHNPLNPNHGKPLLQTGELPVTSMELATPTSENVSSKCSKRSRTCGSQADLAKYARPNTILNSNPERKPSAPCRTDKVPPCAKRPHPKSEKCSTRAWSNPQHPNGHHKMFREPKKDGSLRFCVDYRRLNAKNVADAYLLPRIGECLHSLGAAQIFKTLDCNAGYWQVPVAPEDREKKTFTSYLGTYFYVRMAFGFRNAPETFRRALDIIL